jgi:hypothetical protein
MARLLLLKMQLDSRFFIWPHSNVDTSVVSVLFYYFLFQFLLHFGKVSRKKVSCRHRCFVKNQSKSTLKAKIFFQMKVISNCETLQISTFPCCR